MNTPWVEKYRPVNFDDIILEHKNKEIFLNMLELDTFPNILAHGFPGTGKTTAIINLLSAYYAKKAIPASSMVIHLNASDERGIDIIRNQINTFVTTQNLLFTKKECLKFVVFDEVDYMTKSAQQALRYLIQTTPKNVRFCLMCNYVSRIDESLQNEFMKIRFNSLPLEKMVKFIEKICVSENVSITTADIFSLIRYFNNDVRSMINFLQCNQTYGYDEMSLSILNEKDFEQLHFEMLKTSNCPLNPKNTSNSTKLVLIVNTMAASKNVSPRQLLLHFFHFLLLHPNKFPYTTENINSLEDIVHGFALESKYCIPYTCEKIQKMLQRVF